MTDYPIVPTLTTNYKGASFEIKHQKELQFNAVTDMFLDLKQASDVMFMKSENGGVNPYESEYNAQIFAIMKNPEIRYPEIKQETIFGAKYRKTYPTDERRVPFDWWFCGAYVPSMVPNKQTSLIATQGHPRHTLEHFLCVVEEQKVETIVMLTPHEIIVKGEKATACERYWPLPDKPLVLEDITLTFVNSTFQENIRESEYMLEVEGSKKSRKIKHIQYENCEDFGVPRDIGQFVELVYRMKQNGGIQMVHCDAGVGRTGMYCAIYLLIEIYEEIMKGTQIELSVPNVLLHLRKSRDGMISNWRQYQFIYDALEWLFCNIRSRNF